MGRNVYVANLKECISAYSKYFIIPSRGNISSLVRIFLSMVNKFFSKDELGLQLIRADNEMENLRDDFMSSFDEIIIKIEAQ